MTFAKHSLIVSTVDCSTALLRFIDCDCISYGLSLSLPICSLSVLQTKWLLCYWSCSFCHLLFGVIPMCEAAALVWPNILVCRLLHKLSWHACVIGCHKFAGNYTTFALSLALQKPLITHEPRMVQLPNLEVRLFYKQQ